jgi:hypothetical protein
MVGCLVARAGVDVVVLEKHLVWVGFGPEHIMR